MITFSDTVKALLTSGNIGSFYTVRITDQNGAVVKSVTTNSYDIIINGITYYADGTLLALDPPQISTNVNREQFKISFADVNFLESSKADHGLIGSNVEVRTGFLDNTNNSPILNLADTFIVYKGKVDGTGYAIRMENQGECVLQITCASPMADLDFKRAMTCSREYVRGRHPTDSSCDQVYNGSGGLALKWGKL